MKKFALLVVVAFGTLVAAAQTKPNDWKELKDFHDVMSQTFHPAEEGKLDPLKQRSGEIVEKATTWQNSVPPPEFNKPEIKKSLKTLVKGSKSLDKMVKKGEPDADLTKKLTELHDVFHEIVGLCKDGH
jgi:predicted HAD superfamily Cof-like phosphohydrolase